ncbi:hypothetical protein BDZ89DRAFT_1161381 [Hymenopellis radicata]|nr:hypothetical protein BDZ89DRAFT_1161381 [Hymenopellis radicata]
MGRTDNGFVFTDEDNRISNLLWAATSGVGAGCCFLVLLVIVGAMIHPDARRQLDRVSFRIMTYALVANMVFGLASTVCGLQKHGGTSCDVSMFLLMLTLEISTFLLFCIALNLQLVLVHGVNGQAMEKWYYIGSVSAALAVTVPPFAAHQYGWDPLNSACWYTSSDVSQRLRWQVSTQIMWSLGSAVGEIIMFFTVLTYMIRHQIIHGQAVRSRSLSTGTRSRANSVGGGAANVPTQHVKTYRGIIMRIALYPLASLIINSVTVACDLHATLTTGVSSVTAYNVLLLNDFCYGGRPIVYALLAATDPSLVRAVKSLWRSVWGRSDITSGDTSTGGPKTNPSTTSQGQITVHIELNEMRQLDDGTPVPPSPAVKATQMPKDVEDLDIDDDPMATRLEATRRARIGRAMEIRQDTLDKRQERKEFKKQI